MGALWQLMCDSLMIQKETLKIVHLHQKLQRFEIENILRLLAQNRTKTYCSHQISMLELQEKLYSSFETAKALS